MEDNFSTDQAGVGEAGMVQVVMRVMGSDGERWGAADGASLVRPPLISCCAARFLTGHGPGVGDPCLTQCTAVQ